MCETLTLIDSVNKLAMRFFNLQGSGRFSTCADDLRVLWILSRQSSCSEAMRRETQPMWTWGPVATNRRLSLWPQVRAVTGLWNRLGSGLETRSIE